MTEMTGQMNQKRVKEIKVDVNKCTGCRACEMACSAFHATPKYSSVNPARSRIRVVMDELRDVYVPIRAGDYTEAACSGRLRYTVEGKEYNECGFCRASCPARDYFKDPESGLPLMCDMCETDPPLPEPMCAQVCDFDALTYEELEAAGQDVEGRDELELGLSSLLGRYGFRKISDSLIRRSLKG